jgi:transcription antitermination factor NusG
MAYNKKEPLEATITPSTISSNNYYRKFITKEIESIREMTSEQRYILVETITNTKALNFMDTIKYITNLEMTDLFITNFTEEIELGNRAINPIMFLGYQRTIEDIKGKLSSSIVKLLLDIDWGFTDEGYSIWKNEGKKTALYEEDVIRITLLLAKATDYDGITNLRHELQSIMFNYANKMFKPIIETVYER